MTALPSPTWAARVHAAHIRLGVTLLANCEACCKDDRPEWVKRATERRLPVKDYTATTR